MKTHLLHFLLLLCCCSVTAQTITTVAGGNGKGDSADQLNAPNSVFIDTHGYIYVADYFNNRIQMFPPGSDSTTDGVTVAGGNGYGNAANQLEYPAGVFVDQLGYIYVADWDNNRIQKFPPGSTSATAGMTVAGGNGLGGGANQLSHPNSVFVDAAGDIYVADQNNERILEFPPGSTADSSGVTRAGGNSSGAGADQLFFPAGVAADSSGYLYVADEGNNRVQRFPPFSVSVTPGVTVAGDNGDSSAADQLNSPSGVFIDGSGNLYVADMGNDRIQKFPPGSDSTTNGITVAGGNGEGSAANQLNSPEAIYVDDSGNIYIADGANNRIQKWTQISTGIKNIQPGTQQLTLYPNPTTGAFTLETTNSIHQPFTIYDMLGNKVWQDMITADKQVVELKGLTAGSYMVRVGNGISSIPIVIQK